MNKLFFLLLLLSVHSAFAQPTKVYSDPNAKTRTISAAFTKIQVSSGVELYLTQGNETALAVSVSAQKYEEKLKTTVENGELKIYYDNKGITWVNDKNRKLKVYLSFKEIEKITASGGAHVEMINELNANDLKLSFSSGASFAGKIRAKSLEAAINSGAEMEAAGQTGHLTVSASSGATFKGFDLVTEICSASASSGGTVRVQVQEELKASANSGGSIRYKGNAVLQKGNIHSGGSVKNTNS
jgi:hypothetical protein